VNLATDLAAALDPASAREHLGGASSEPWLSPASLALAVNPGFQIPPHIELLDRAIVETVNAGGRLLVAMPPRHGKSEMASRYTPAWYLGRYPNRRVILSSYEADYAASWGRKARDLLEEHGSDLFGVRVREDSHAANRWDIADHGGGMTTAGVGGAITGRGADLLIIDDPVKSVEEAESETYRARTFDWWRGVALTRLEPNGAVILVMTRWHQDDLAGRILQEGSANWSVITLPAIADDPGDLLGRAEGEALWPDRYDVDALARRRQEMGSRLFQAEYQQEPAPATGSIFKREWMRYWRPLASGVYDLGSGRVAQNADCRRFTTCDLAVSTKTNADFTVLATWALTPSADLILLDMARARIEGPDIVPALRHAYELHKPDVIGIEASAFQLVIVQEARRAGLPIKALRPDRDKVSRALAAAARMEGGQVFFEDGAPYLDVLESELTAFPHGRHDDIVDTLAYAVLEAVDSHGPRLRWLT
jgi:predicted phage terminase large subunit-like protein